MYYSLGEYNQTKDLHEKALTIRKKIFGEDHADLASSYNNLVLVNNRLSLLSVFYDTFVVVFVVFVIYFDGEGELAYEIRCCEKIPAVQPVGREMLERNAVNLPMLRHTTILVGDHTRRPILQIGPESS